MSKWAEATIKYETDYHPANVKALADHVYNISDMAAPISSGSFHTDGMIVVPCNVTLKERRKLVLVTRETPLSDIHLRNMLSVSRSGTIICLPVPAFYIRPSSVEDLVNQSVGRMLDMFNFDGGNFELWKGWEKE
ncbi:unnamed protein product [Penicillium discolor]